MTTSHASGSAPTVSAIVKGEFVGPVQTVFAMQPKFPAEQTAWNAYDVPRMWDMVRDEGSQLAWARARGWENLAQLLAEQHDSLRRLRDGLAGGWDPRKSLGAEAYFNRVDKLLLSMREDALAHSSTARGLDGVLSTLEKAKDLLGPMKEEWDAVTTDWLPEWWDSAAGELNEKARQVMAGSDKVIADQRSDFVIPVPFGWRISGTEPSGPPSINTRAGNGPGPRTSVRSGQQQGPPPPVPGYDPVVNTGGPVLQGAPQLVPAVPGTPVSVLPVPPGSPYAPGGGAYVLPGPGVGRGGWIAPMPRGSVGGGATTTTAGSRPLAGGGIMPMVSPVGAPGRRGGATSDGNRHRDVVWEVASGVSPVIGAADYADLLRQQAERDEQEGKFVDWFASVATPWSEDLKVTIKRRPEEPS